VRSRVSIGVLLCVVVTAAHGALITENVQITLPEAAGYYSAGHIFNVIATYDSAGAVMHSYLDGPNGVAEFGAGDDTTETTWNRVDYADSTFFSDAALTISGLTAPPGYLSPWNRLAYNQKRVQAYGNPAIEGFQDFILIADDIYFVLRLYGPDYVVYRPDAGTFFLSVIQFYSTTDGWGRDSRFVVTGSTSESIRRSSVPEPATLALLSIGVVGIGYQRRARN